MPPQENQPENTIPNEFIPQEVEEKKSKFFKRVKIAGLIILSLLILAVITLAGRFIYLKTKSTYVVNEKPEPKDSTQVVIVNPEKPKEDDSWETFSNSNYKFSLQYPKDDILIFNKNNSGDTLLKIIYKDVIPKENPSGENLVKGYIVTVNPLELLQRDIDTVTNVKREYFKLNCPDSATITEKEGRKIDGIEGRGFKVTNCNSNYDVSYIPGDNYIYEIIKIYKGDLGFEQNYKSIVNQIEQTIDVKLDSENTGPYLTYSDNSISFEYPKTLDTSCCQVPQPPINRVQNIITLAENDDSQAVGLFTSYSANGDLNSFVENQKVLLSDDYKVVKGTAPNGTEEEITIAGQRALVLSGYSWRGNDFIYLLYPNGRNLLTISKTDISEDSFNHIIDTLKFLN